MKICHVNLASGYHGGENQTLLLIQQQIKLGYQLTVVANPKSLFYSRVKELPCRLIACKHFLTQHGKAITQDSDLIHVHEGRAIYWAWLQYQLYKIPYIITRRIDNPLSERWFAAQAYCSASALVGLSQEICRQILLRYPLKKVVTIPSSPVRYPINQQQVSRIREQFSHPFLVIHAANMLHHKGFDVTLAAARLLMDSESDIHFALLGDGKERPALEQQAKGLTNVHFMGKQNNMGDWFAAADMLIHPSYSEGLGSVILEAMGSGLPVVGSRAGGIPDIIEDRVSGLLITPGDAQELAQAILQVRHDPNLVDVLTIGREKKLRDFQIEQTAQRYHTLYSEIMKSNACCS
ncbi:glycosyltransferase family 4 protein [Vibrio metschnikovii]|uniref:glycosyltransferase family 4 protein n=1 Tax=Vibrio TaxID=662 RepID=UPI001482736C|nr:MULTISPECIES: glycosyltransferase family 4 protein [unclassified Vibrio]EKO3583212.1 glycosyltransferase family 4 protein [Vibrio metschnikovii]EKO3666676.1 glycosyltransferase family 4 protein [Vibrio metschnikovii]EKO3687489.1 glycosyltransferase family 4 protein [Vibrio metschnikovii]EKO3690919.1 glycosyltransferase family 4 protein [Vibrio metschnikovii]EKO3773338.1 glycosyltransferase family 4 protein [Vibrio metschnikovii]